MNNTILIVEDSLTQIEQLKYILENEGYAVKTASNGVAACEALKESKPDLVISDIIMPEMGGYELCRFIKQDLSLKSIPVMLLTSLGDPKDVIKGLQAGADNFLTKPFNEKFLLSRVKYILLNRELRRGIFSSEMGVEIVFGGDKYFINSDKMQIIDLLLSTYENAVQKNGELFEANQKLLLMHREVAQKNSELQKLNVEKDKFLGMAAHDLRNPIGTILLVSQLLFDSEKNKFSDEDKEFLEMIRSSSEFMLKLLNELLDIAVMESGNLQLHNAETDLVKLIGKNVSYNKIIADKKNIVITFNTLISTAQKKVDAVKIEQVLNNLISNAIKYSFENTEITVTLTEKETEYILSVADKGQGIPEKDMHKLFQAFSTTSVKSTAGERSTGLGLSIVKKIVEAHNAKIWVESKVDEGTTFFVSFTKD